MGSNYLVTGGAGFIGSHLATALVRRGDRVKVYDNLCTGFVENLRHIRNDIEFIEGDICNESLLATALVDVEVVFHQAALASVPLSLERPLDVHRACAEGTLHVLTQSHRAGVRRVVYAGSSSCYGNPACAANRETDPIQPMSPYAAAKLSGERYCQSFYNSFGLETVVLRYFNVFGPRQDPNSDYSAVIPLFITRLLSGQQPIIFGDGKQTRDFTFVGNVVDGNLLAAETATAAGLCFNIADGRSTTLLELLSNLGSLLSVDVAPDFQPPRPGDIRDSQSDISFARRVLGFEPKINLKTGLELSIDYYRASIEKTLDTFAAIPNLDPQLDV